MKLQYGREGGTLRAKKNRIVGAVTKVNEVTESQIKKPETKFTLDLKTMITKPSTDTDLNRVKLAKIRNDRYMAPECYKQQFNGLSLKGVGVDIQRRQNYRPDRTRKETSGQPKLRTYRNNKNDRSLIVLVAQYHTTS